ncbi:hypothetical protein BKA64DRAFT_58280 [Cadophora sp. MPI-SDFR-AT-0126]|nr:hypothetical protein BKA64DRAFT_58280 [Leotiomycetes sp. MPI-SDFR-AT-0126]
MELLAQIPRSRRQGDIGEAVMSRSISSGRTGSCSTCNHLNTEHTYTTYKESTCRKQWKVCQAGG